MRDRTFTESPPTRQGAPRYFDRDDIVALFVLRHFMDETTQPKAAKIASAVRAALRKMPEDAESLWLVSKRSGGLHYVASHKPPMNLLHYHVPVRELRRNIERIAKERFG